MTMKMFAESAVELEPELERHYRQYESRHGGTRALAEVLLGDTSYVEELRMPKHNGPTTILREPRAAVRYANQLGIPTSKSAHRQREEYFATLADTLEVAWNDLVNRCLGLFGKHGSWCPACTEATSRKKPRRD